MPEAIALIDKLIAEAKADLDHERARGPRSNNLVVAIAAHKVAWLKEIRRQFETKKPRQP